MDTFRRLPVPKTFNYQPDIPQNIRDVVTGSSEPVQGNHLLYTAATARAAAASTQESDELSAAALHVEQLLQDVHDAKVSCSIQRDRGVVLKFVVARQAGKPAFAALVWDTAVHHACRAQADKVAIKLGIPPEQLDMVIQQMGAAAPSPNRDRSASSVSAPDSHAAQ